MKTTGLETAEQVISDGWGTQLSETVARCLLFRSNEAIMALLGKLSRMVERRLSNVSSGLSDLGDHGEAVVQVTEKLEIFEFNFMAESNFGADFRKLNWCLKTLM